MENVIDCSHFAWEVLQDPEFLSPPGGPEILVFWNPCLDWLKEEGIVASVQHEETLVWDEESDCYFQDYVVHLVFQTAEEAVWFKLAFTETENQ
jgi:hypothetical protein